MDGFRRQFTRLIRYGATSLLALGTSELTLLAIVAGGVNPTAAAFIANLVGMIPSYLLSRYWIWPTASRARLGRQVTLYWLTSIVSMTITSFSTGAIAAIAPHRGANRLLVVGSAFFVVSVVLWVTKYIVYQHIIFPEPVTLQAEVPN